MILCDEVSLVPTLDRLPGTCPLLLIIGVVWVVVLLEPSAKLASSPISMKALTTVPVTVVGVAVVGWLTLVVVAGVTWCVLEDVPLDALPEMDMLPSSTSAPVLVNVPVADVVCVLPTRTLELLVVMTVSRMVDRVEVVPEGTLLLLLEEVYMGLE